MWTFEEVQVLALHVGFIFQPWKFLLGENVHCLPTGCRVVVFSTVVSVFKLPVFQHQPSSVSGLSPPVCLSPPRLLPTDFE